MSKPKVGVSMLYCMSEPFNRMVKRLGTMDTNYIEVVDDGTYDLNETRIAQLKEAAKSFGLTYSVHAPFADLNIGSPAKPMLTAAVKRLKQSLANATKLDAKMWVFHPAQITGISQFYPDALFKQTCESVKQLCAVGEDFGINMAMENLPAKYGFMMSTPAEFQRLFKETGLPFGVTLDLGHAHLEGQIQPFFDQLADRIVHIHASNNDGSDDQHNGVLEGNINYQDVVANLKRIGYDKTVLVESIRGVPESIAELKRLLV